MSSRTFAEDSSRDAVDGILSVIDEGSKNGTPKLGLLLAIIECCTRAIERGTMVNELIISGEELADAYLGIYWNHTAPFEGHGVLHQLSSRNREHFAVTRCQRLRCLLEGRNQRSGFLTSWVESRAVLAAEFPDQLAQATREMRVNLWKNPVVRLQQFGGEEWSFLYTKTDNPWTLRLHPGVGGLLADFGPVLRPIIERRFAQIVEQLNPDKVGIVLADTVYGHLFLTAERAMPNQEARAGLLDLQSGRCMWTGSQIDRHVPADHVAPWSRRSISVLENFTLTTTSANSSKSSSLLTQPLLAHWLAWLANSLPTLKEIAESSGFVSDVSRPIDGLMGLYRTNHRVPLWGGIGETSLPTVRDLDGCVAELESFNRAQVTDARFD